MFDLQVLSFSHMRVIESVSTVSTGVNSWFVLNNKTIESTMKETYEVDENTRMSKSWMTSITVDNTLVSTVFSWSFGNQVHGNVGINLERKLYNIML